MSIDLVHDDVEKSLIQVTLKQQRECICVRTTSESIVGAKKMLFIYLHCHQEVDVIKSCQERMRRHLDRAIAQLA